MISASSQGHWETTGILSTSWSSWTSRRTWDLLDVRLIGVIEAVQIENGKSAVNNRLLGVSVHSYSHAEVSSLDEIDNSLLEQVEEFFVSYNKSRGKKFKVKGWRGPKRARQLLENGMREFRKRRKK